MHYTLCRCLQTSCAPPSYTVHALLSCKPTFCLQAHVAELSATGAELQGQVRAWGCNWSEFEPVARPASAKRPLNTELPPTHFSPFSFQVGELQEENLELSAAHALARQQLGEVRGGDFRGVGQCGPLSTVACGCSLGVSLSVSVLEPFLKHTYQQPTNNRHFCNCARTFSKEVRMVVCQAGQSERTLKAAVSKVIMLTGREGAAAKLC